LKSKKGEQIQRRTKMNTSTTTITLDTLLKERMSEFDIGEEYICQEDETEQAAEVVQSARQVRPWVRYFSRTVDIFLFSILIAFMLGMFAPSVLELPSALLTMIILFVWIFQEAVLLANCGTTPGKWLFKIKVRNSRGQKLTFSEALNRSFGVWVKGMGAGVPLISLITLLSSRSKLKRDGITTWDEDGGFVVTHGEIGAARAVVVIVLLLGYFTLITLGSMLEGTEDFGFVSNSIESQGPFAEPIINNVEGGQGTYSIEYDSSTWTLDKEVSNPDADYEFNHCGGEAYAMLIYERTPIPLTMLEAAAIENLKSAASDVKILSRETIQLGNHPILSMQCEATIMTIPLMYNYYLSSNEHGTLQFIAFTSKYLFDEYQQDCKTLLNGLNFKNFELQTVNEIDNDTNKADFPELIRNAEKWLEN
jgi:uncharacterized RDD family membrane protein YckC